MYHTRLLQYTTHIETHGAYIVVRDLWDPPIRPTGVPAHSRKVHINGHM